MQSPKAAEPEVRSLQGIYKAQPRQRSHDTGEKAGREE